MVLPLKVALLLLPALACAAYTPQSANLNGRARRSSHSKNLPPTNGGNIDHPPPILAVGLPVQGPPSSNPTHPSNKATSPPNKPVSSSTKSTSPPDRSIPPSRSSSSPPKQPKATTQKSALPPTKSAPTSRPTPSPKQSTHSTPQPKSAPSSTTKGSPSPSLPPPPGKPTHSAPAPTTGTTAQTTSIASPLATPTTTSFTSTTDETTQTRARTRTHPRHRGTFVPAPPSLPAPTAAPGGGGEERITFTQEFSVAFEELSVAIGPIPTHREDRLKHPPTGNFAMFPALPTNAGGGDWCFEDSDCGSLNSICCEGQCISYAGDSGTCDTREDLKVDACAFDNDCPGFNIFEVLEGSM